MEDKQYKYKQDEDRAYIFEYQDGEVTKHVRFTYLQHKLFFEELLQQAGYVCVSTPAWCPSFETIGDQISS
tara:strand:+ start:95 stop:307 length:213 start_codon:yes stop_codon:yes gene_type:complete